MGGRLFNKARKGFYWVADGTAESSATKIIDADTGNINVSTNLQFGDGESIVDSSSNELIKFAVTSSAVNEVSVTNAATGNAPSLSATGGDTNISVVLKGKGTGAVRLGQATSTDVRLEADQPIADSSGNEYIKFSKTASAVNEYTITNAATGNFPTIAATGGDTNIHAALSGKGTGVIALGQATCAGVMLVADQPIVDSSANEYIKFSKTASAVNEITITNKATGGSPLVQASGGDTNIGLRIAAKGTGQVAFNNTVVLNTTPASRNTAGNDTFTAAQLLGGIIVRDPNGAGRTDALDTAANLVAAIPGAAIGDTIRCHIVNGADANETITLQAGAGGAFDANQTAASQVITQNQSKDIYIRLTNVTPAAEAYVVYA